jgi:hypothetical protein
MGWDAVRRPSPEHVLWALAFAVFAMAAGAEVLGAILGWNPSLARIYYLTGAVLVVGILALGELYLLWPQRMPAVTPGIALLLVAVAVTAVWSAPINAALVQIEGWQAIERGPFLVALTVTMNAGGTLVLVGGALYSAYTLRSKDDAGRRAVGCVLIAVGAITVALGGTLTRFGRLEYLYVAMAVGIALIFAGVLLTRSTDARRTTRISSDIADDDSRHRSPGARLISLPSRPGTALMPATAGEGIRFVVESLLPREADAVADACRRWSASPVGGDALSRDQAHQVWALRVQLPEEARNRYDQMPLPVQAQLAELYDQVWSGASPQMRDDRRA